MDDFEEMDDLLVEFLTETNESLTDLDGQMVQFEQDPSDMDILGNIFRLVHTIKGTCGFLGLPRLESVAHAGENVLGKFRDGVLEVTPEAVTLILKCLDTIRDLLGVLEETSSEPEGSDAELIAELNAMADGGGAPAPAPAAEAAPAGDDDPSANEFGAPVAAELLAEVEAALRAMVTYKEYNLLTDLSPLGKFDIVFCRNVLIYFDQDTKGKVLEQISRLMADDGVLFLGGAETVLGVSDKFKPISGFRGVYCKAESDLTFAS